MIQYTRYSGSLDEEMVVKIIEDLNYYTKLFHQNKIEDPESDDTLIVYFATIGGEVCLSDLLVNLFNRFNKTTKLFLIAYREISSAGFKLFSEYNGPKNIIDDTIAIIHLHTMDVTSRDLEDKGSITSVLLDNLKERYESIIATMGVTKLEKDRLRKGGDLVLTYDRLHKLFKSSLSANI